MPLPATCAGDAVILRCAGIWMRRAALAALAAAATAAAILLLSSCVEKIFPCEAEDLYGSWRTSDGKIQLKLDSNRSYSIQFENNKQRLVRASGKWEPATIDDEPVLELHDFPVLERFHNARYARNITSPAKTGFYYLYPQRKLSGSCVIIYMFEDGLYMEKEKPLSP